MIRILKKYYKCLLVYSIIELYNRGCVFIELTDLTIRILFLFLPGILAITIIDTLTSHRKRKALNFFINSYLLGIGSYVVVSILVWSNNKIVEIREGTPTWETTFIPALLDSKKDINPTEVFSATFIGCILAIIIVIIIQKRLLYRIAAFLRLSNKHGDDDLWDYFFNIEEIEWITLRDKDKNLVYQGAVNAYSQKDDKRELILTDVQVFDHNIEDLYEMDIMYFNFETNSNITIEFKRSESNEEDSGNSGKA